MDALQCNKKMRLEDHAVESDEEQNDEKRLSILELNDDCLLIIFSYLNIWQLMTAEDACERFKFVAEIAYRTRRMLQLRCHTSFQHPHDHEKVILADVQDIVKRLNPRMHSLTVYGCKFASPIETLLSILGKCSNLRKLYLVRFSLRKADCLDNLFRAFGNVKVADFKDCGLTDNILEVCLRQATQLESLRVSLNASIQGYWLTELKNIKSIDLSHCRIITECFLIQFLQNNEGLKSLSINGSNFASSARYYRYHQAISRYSTSLETLKITIWANTEKDAFTLIASLPRLKHLMIDIRADFDVDLLMEKLGKRNVLESLHIHCFRDIGPVPDVQNLLSFSKLKSLQFRCFSYPRYCDLVQLGAIKTLEELSLEYCIAVTNEGLVELINNCQTLKLLNIIGCSRITNDFIPGILPSMHNRTTFLQIVVVNNQSIYNFNNPKFPKLKVTCKYKRYW
ncbi:uncharacterized protein LOC132259878 [Phlebotomus argentipes]|uniref:uncharacterized protein LOC132259878 n=1 Tax=Phlebotomus argentipes TaxID=94469 RepID=UPI0028937236|nr:uncharacterized protein LOC132259878 [Phlebotomus argentipes]